MSQAIMSIRQLKPDVRLAQSIQRFQSLLSNEQQAAFYATRDAALQSTPQPHDVMHITEEIERQARASTGGGWRCFAPRITKVLQSLQEFVSVGDILIGGSQNLIACGVWSVVRLSLLTAARISSYLEKLSDLLMAMGQAAPRYQEMVALYPHSKSLQRLGIEYMIALVNLCCRVVTICKASTIGRLVTFFTDSDISSHQSELLKWADAIKDQLSLEEAKANSRVRGTLSTFTAENLRHRKLKGLAALLNACSIFDYQIAWNQSRKCGNSSWFLSEDVYQQWRDNPTSSMITVSGKLGTGKTVVLANVLGDIYLKDMKEYAVAYFFCRADHIESRKHQTVIGCLGRQILQALRLEDSDEFNSELQRKLSENINELFTLKILRSKYIFVVLDGIDECEPEDRLHVIEFLKQLEICGRLKVCVSYRLTANTRVRDELEGLGSSATLQMPENNPDIAQFIQAKLESCLETKKLTIGDPVIILEIVKTLEAGAQGMFLWAVLQIETICTQKTDNQIREALHNLPKDLPETFTRSLASANKSAPEFQERLLKLLLAAVRPLTVDELREGLSVTPFSSTWDQSNLINDVQAILSAGGSLLFVDEEQLTVHFIHPSVNQFLIGDFGLGHSFYIEPSLADLEMAQTVVTYLSSNAFDRQVARVQETSNVSHRKLNETIVSSIIASPVAQSLALMLLRSHRQNDFDVGKALTNFNSTITKRQDVFSFHGYASANWIAHTKAIQSDDERFFSMIRKALDRSPMLMPARLITVSNLPFNFHFQELIASTFLEPHPYASPILWSLENSHLGIFRSSIRKSILNVMYSITYVRHIMHTMTAKLAFRNLEPHIYVKLFCLAALFNYQTICRELLTLKPSPISLVDMVDLIPPSPLNGLAIALVLVQAQAHHGFSQPTLEMRPMDYRDCYSHDRGRVRNFVVVRNLEVTLGCHKLVILHSGEKVRLLPNQHDNQLRVFRRKNPSYFSLPLKYLRPLDARLPNFRTCCDAHVGVLIGETRLCACCVPQKYKQVVGQLGDFEIEEPIPSNTIRKTYWSLKEEVPQRESAESKLEINPSKKDYMTLGDTISSRGQITSEGFKLQRVNCRKF